MLFFALFFYTAHALAENFPSDSSTDLIENQSEARYQAPKYAVSPSGKTLPKGIFKLDFPTAYTFGGKGFDSKGNSVDNGVYMSRWIEGFLIQYGLTNSISIGVGIPVVLSNQLSLDGNKVVANTESYKRNYDRVVEKIAEGLIQNGLCQGTSSTQTCIDIINNGATLPNIANYHIPLPTGEMVIFNSGSPVKDQIRDLLLKVVEPSNGAKGIGDLQIGVLWSIISENSPIKSVPFYLSVGGGLRIPTGKFDIASAFRPTGGDNTLITGGGTYDAIFRINLDYVATPGMILSWQHMAEYSLTTAKLGRTSMLDNTKKNTANPFSEPKNDQVGNTLTFSRKGLHHIGFLQAAWGLGNVTEELKSLGLFTQAKYNIAAKAFLNNQPIYTLSDQANLNDSSMHPDNGVEQYYSAAIGVKLSGLPYRIPVELSSEFEYPFAGKNRMVSPMNSKTTLSIFF